MSESNDQLDTAIQHKGGAEPEYGWPPRNLTSDDAEEIVRVVMRFEAEARNPDYAPVRCYDCDKTGYQMCCHMDAIVEATPTTWRAVKVCTDCADRSDPLCGAEPSDLDHPSVRKEAHANA